MSKTQKLQEQLSALKLEMIKLEPQRARYYEVSRLYSEVEKEYKEILKSRNYEEATWKTNYNPPDFPSMGNTGFSGSATFNSKHDADFLLRVLRENSDYYVAHFLNWEGTGIYTADVSWEKDHDNEVIYTVTFKRLDEV